MEAIYLFILLLIGLTIILGIILGDSSRTDVIAHWAERRCDFDVIISAFMYRPAEDKRGAAEFASDNFKFCITSKTTDYLNTIFGALYEVMRKQMGAADIMGQVMKVLRVQLNSIYAPFSKMMDQFWHKFKEIGSLSSRIFQHLFMSMKKAGATAVASIYVALSLQTAFLNSIDLVIKIIMVVLYILLALAIIFFLPILPVMIFVFMATAGIESAFPGRTGGMGAVFCFAPDTVVVMKDNTTQSIKNIKLGDILLSGQKVEAVIEVPGSSEALYSVKGTIVSGDHRIWDSKNKSWTLVKDYSDAVKTNEMLPALWTLITSNRQIPVMCDDDTLIFSDWEEIPNSDEAALVWENIVQSTLNKSAFPSTKVKAPQYAPCFDRSTFVKKYQGGWAPLYDISRGDWIMGDGRWTQVIGICDRVVEGGHGEKGFRMTDGIWIKDKFNQWSHLPGKSDTYAWQGMNLITDSGSFYIRTGNLTEYLVRDFTEVGWMNLRETYTRVEDAMKKKI